MAANGFPVAPTGSAFEMVLANQTNQILGTTGAIGDVVTHLVIIPLTTSPGAVSITDGSGTAMTVFVGGTVPSVIPFPVPLNTTSLSGGWKVTTGANVAVLGVGNFT